MTDITIAVADPHPVLRAGIQFFCEERGLRVVAECDTAAELLDAVAESRPRYVVVDPAVSGQPFHHLLSELAALNGATRIIVHCTSRNHVRIRSMLRAGASGYILKDGPASQLTDATARIEAGKQYVSPLLGAFLNADEQLADQHIHDEKVNADVAIHPKSVLSEREYQVFLQLGSGVRPRDIAKSLSLSAKTVDTYRASILRKLKIEGIAALVRLAAQVQQE